MLHCQINIAQHDKANGMFFHSYQLSFLEEKERGMLASMYYFDNNSLGIGRGNIDLHSD